MFKRTHYPLLYLLDVDQLVCIQAIPLERRLI